ncbi:MAG: DUF87 domain-containing protein [Micromonosporaceae bacterium]|nr:DUF87 domain-containing protein [Micromonosporaceae bacterium]
MSLIGPGLRLPRHRGTTANLCAIYPFQAGQGLGPRGVYLGSDVLTGGGAFCYDPFELYTQGLLTSPNMLVLGDVGSGKSTAVKTLLFRSVGVLGSPGGAHRWVAIVDPKGEYQPLAEALDLAVLRLRPGGSTRLNPLEGGPAESDELIARRAGLVAALISELLGRDLGPLEDAAVGWAVTDLTRTPRRTPPVLGDLVRLLADPSREMLGRARLPAKDLVGELAAARHALGKLLDRDLRGMFDGPSTVDVDWAGRGLVIDLSAVHQDPLALRLVMVAATGWLQTVMASHASGPGVRRYQVLEEVWALLASERTAKYLQSAFKLARAYGVANIAVAHRIADLYAQADDGTAAAKAAAGLLSDTQTRVLFRQPPDQVDQARRLLGLTSAEAGLLPELAKGRALWKVAGRSAIVQHVLAPAERALCDTDARLLV